MSETNENGVGEAEGEPNEATADPPAERDPLVVMTEERDRMKDQLLRTAADFDNFRKRSRRDIEEATHRATEETLRELLPIIDNLERAVAATENATDPKAVADGVRMVLRQFEDISTRLGLTRLQTIGERFDPQIHDAVQQMETTAHPPGTISMEVVAGYQMGERLVRPAMVVVAKAPPEESPLESEEGDGDGAESQS